MIGPNTLIVVRVDAVIAPWTSSAPRLAASIEVPFLGAIPLGAAVREEGDRGIPTVIGRPDSAEALALTAVARATLVELATKMEEVTPA